MSPDLGGADRAFEDRRDLSERQFLEATQEQNLPCVAIQSVERAVKQGVIVTGHGTIAGVRLIVGMMLQFAGVGRSRRDIRLAVMVGGTTAREVIHPGGEVAFVAIGVPVFQDALENDLSDVLGGVAIPRDLGQEAEERTVVAFEEFAKRVEFAIADGEHQFMVGLGGGYGHGGSSAKLSRGGAGGNAEV